MIKTVGVVTGGPMAPGAAEVSARAGYNTWLYGEAEEQCQKVLSDIKASLQKDTRRGSLTENQAQEAVARLRPTTRLEDLASCDLVIDALPEEFELKKQLLAKLEHICSPETIFGCNTSVLPITYLAYSTSRPDRVIGLHFFLPTAQNRLIEVIPPEGGSPETLAAVKAFVESLGKVAIVPKDSPGFIVVHLHVGYLLEAIRVLESGIAAKEDIDTAIETGLNFPVGPIKLLDFLGLDLIYKVATVLYDEYKDPRFAPPPLMRRMVLAGHLGRKTGKGFYDYTSR